MFPLKTPFRPLDLCSYNGPLSRKGKVLFKIALTSQEKKVLGFLILMVLLGLAALAWKRFGR
jgi:hypothetical protein